MLTSLERPTLPIGSNLVQAAGRSKFARSSLGECPNDLQVYIGPTLSFKILISSNLRHPLFLILLALSTLLVWSTPTQVISPTTYFVRKAAYDVLNAASHDL